MSDRIPAARASAALFASFREKKCAESFRALVENYAGLVQGTAARILKSEESARDVTQAVFADLVRLAPQLAPDTTPGGWLHRHTVFLALRQRRADLRRGLREEEAQRRWSLDEADAPPSPWLADLDEALNRLPEADRRALTLRYLEEQPLRDVGAALGISEDAAQKRISRALEKLRTQLVQRGCTTVSAGALTAAVTAIPQSAASAAEVAAAALSAASNCAVPTAGAWTTFFAMNTKSILAGAAASAVLTGGILVPVILSQRNTIADLETRLHTLPAATVEKDTARNPQPVARRTAPHTENRRQTEYEEQKARLEPVKDRVKAWTESVRQVDDAALKQKALEEMLEAMGSGSEQDITAALTAYSQVGNVEFDRAGFRPAILKLLGSKDAFTRRTALGLIPGLPEDEGDLQLVMNMAEDTDPGVRQQVIGSLFWLTKRNLTGDAGVTVLGILNRTEIPSRSLIDVMWGAQFTPELEQKLVEYARAERQPDDEELPYYAVYSCLSTQQNKGPACVSVLIERLSHADSYNVGGRAAWGLAYGVQPGLGLEKQIADAAIKVWKNRSDGYLREQLLKCLERYGDPSHAEQLEEAAAAPAMGAEQAKVLTKLAAGLRLRAQTTAPGKTP